MLSLSMAHCIGKPGQPLPVYRLLAANSVEERVHQLVDKRQSVASAFKSKHRYVTTTLGFPDCTSPLLITPACQV